MRHLLAILLFMFSLSYGQNKKVDEVFKEAQRFTANKEYGQAINTYSEALKSYRDNAQLYQERGLIYMSIKEYGKAVEDFSKIIEINDGFVPFAYFHRGISRLSLNNGQTSVSCADLIKAKELGYEANWSDFSLVCPGLN